VKQDGLDAAGLPRDVLVEIDVIALAS